MLQKLLLLKSQARIFNAGKVNDMHTAAVMTGLILDGCGAGVGVLAPEWCNVLCEKQEMQCDEKKG